MSESETPHNTPLQTEKKFHFQFTGSGKEYFRIWIVNLCLTIATLGIYSAWAKVRRLQYFDQNTILADAVFNFHGNPKAIFKGRVVALLLLIAYHYAFGFSKAFGIAFIIIIFLSMPWLLRSALRFRLRNTSYRGLRFNFSGTVAGAYFSYTPLLILLLFPAAFAALFPNKAAWLSICDGLLYLSWPLMHGQIKVYQQSNICYGGLQSSYGGKLTSFIKTYFYAFLIGLFLGFLMMLITGAGIGIWHAVEKGLASHSNVLGVILGAFFAVVYIYIAYLVVGPFVQVRIMNQIWNQTRFPGIEIESTLKIFPYARLQAVNLVLTLLTLGLYRPFAVVRTYQYRLSHITVTCESIDELFQQQQAIEQSASGDGAADFLGVDLSW